MRQPKGFLFNAVARDTTLQQSSDQSLVLPHPTRTHLSILTLSFDSKKTMAGDLEIGLEQLGLEDYAAGFKDAGFLDWDSLTHITEGDLAALNMRLGDRRKLQREIARRHRWPEDMPLPTTEQLSQYTPSSSASRYPLRKNQAELDDSQSRSSLKSSSNTPAREPQMVNSPNVDEARGSSVSGLTCITIGLVWLIRSPDLDFESPRTGEGESHFRILTGVARNSHRKRPLKSNDIYALSIP